MANGGQNPRSGPNTTSSWRPSRRSRSKSRQWARRSRPATKRKPRSRFWNSTPATPATTRSGQSYSRSGLLWASPGEHVHRPDLGCDISRPALLTPASPVAADLDVVARGEYLANAADCAGCHTDIEQGGKPYAGGLPLATPFGTFYTPNITSEPDTGVGRWTDQPILHALR